MTKTARPLALIAGVALAGSLAWAAIPSSEGTLTACANPSGGLRLIDGETETCRSNERQVSWNVSGVPGPMGPAGPTGATGAQGPDGAPGRNGVSGYERVFASTGNGEERHRSIEATCPPGKRVVGGGFNIFSAGPDRQDIKILTSGPRGDNVWGARAIQDGSPIGSTVLWALDVHAICIDG